jgi:hypothetical protein
MPNFMKPIFTALLATSCLIAVPAQAQSKKELAAQNTALAERLGRLESRMLTGDPAAERLMARIDALESAQRALRGELERVAYERDGLKGEVMQLRTELQIIQDMAGRMRVHLDAVDLIAQEQTRPIERRLGPVSMGPTTPLDPLGGAPSFGQQPLVIGLLLGVTMLAKLLFTSISTESYKYFIDYTAFYLILIPLALLFVLFSLAYSDLSRDSRLFNRKKKTSKQPKKTRRTVMRRFKSKEKRKNEGLDEDLEWIAEDEI